jgi:nitrate/TMAO reductase-like tetraheme cytochrome c subunit
VDSKNQGGWEYDSGERDKASRKQRWRRLSLIVMLISLFGLILIATFNHKQEIEKPGFCNRCHEMNEAYTAWQSASHSKVDCSVCHKDFSIGRALYAQKMGIDRIGKKEIVIDDKACKSCHSDARVITPPMDLLVPHNLHVQKGLSCTECHKAVTHGVLAKTDSSTGKGGVVPAVQGEQLFDPNRIPMNECMKCHNGAMATRSCNACHADKEPPATHKATSFKSEHGFSALNDITQCNKCHQYDTTLQVQYKPQGKGWNEIQSFARKTDFCTSCHQARPQGHANLFTVNHGPAAKQDPNRCLTCHNQDDKGKVSEKPVTSVTCAQCHYNQHPADFQKLHPKQLDKSNQSKCFGCHDASSCNDCHNKTFRSKG